MESDREIIKNFGVVLSEGVTDVCKQTAKQVFIASVATYVVYRISKNIYIRYKVKQASKRLRRELAEGQMLVQESVHRWRESSEYAELSKMSSLPLEKFILSLTFESLVEKLQKGELTAFSVLKSYQAKALEQQVLNNCIVGWVLEADKIARDLDDVAAESRKPFHGLPISVKECFYLKNTYSTGGMLTFVSEKDVKNSPAVQTLLNLGAVPFCKTNVPQAMYSMECTNPLYGTTTNPHNPTREAGGSSGGEGSLIGGGGSILGIGSDIGGSLRNPAACCGIYSMKPTIGRHLSYMDVVPTAGPDPAGMQAIGGFMSSSPTALLYAWKELWNITDSNNSQRNDASIAPVRFNQEMFEKKVKIGFFFSDGLHEAVPAVKRAVLQAVKVLKSYNYEVIAFPPPDIKEVLYLFNGLIMADIKTFEGYMSWEVESTALSGIGLTLMMFKIPRLIRKLLIDPILSYLTKIPPMEHLFTSSHDIYKGLQMKGEMSQRYLSMMEDAGVDVIISPGQMFPALPSYEAGQFMPVILPYIPWNLLNMPAGVAPVTKYTQADSEAMREYPSTDFVYRSIHRFCEGATYLPLAVQVVARPFHEEQVLQVLEVLHRNSSTV
ncbi:fatty acid amide hydrolase 1 isoform X1 [Eurytemora carolleeae]|uniref:fatty acid amide hydrolase 1 isoform X1 n=1 Tax=Eurytemora carolleeae TaxID=1294199 RepID=UPI000C785D71|nr:fatty acid amide hydrolase 1 isoform X1 [Eurytemora carolleeae]|eukprot:XP_023329239.1 fatty acid amide hydrolase 1-like isoform X1 [Eurytemora affinis]